MSSPKFLAEKCARARELLEEAHRLIGEVLEDPGYRPDAVLPRGVYPEAVMSECNLGIPILWLTPMTAEEIAESEREERSAQAGLH